MKPVIKRLQEAKISADERKVFVEFPISESEVPDVVENFSLCFRKLLNNKEIKELEKTLRSGRIAFGQYIRIKVI